MAAIETLYLCEKPSQARDIARVLGATERTPHYLNGNDVVVTWCFGHLLEMAAPDQYDAAYKKWSMATLPIVPDRWQHTVRSGARDQYNAIARLLGRTRRVVVATDADREGETIGREILDRCNYRGEIARLWLSALDEASIRTALGRIRDGRETVSLYHAGLGRARADWLVGMNLTRAYTVAARNAGHDQLLSVGRVQTPTLRLVVERDRAIEQFGPQPYWRLRVTFATDAGDVLPAQWRPPADVADDQGRCINENAARRMAQRVAGGTGTVEQVETKHERKSPPLPYDLGTLQQDANRTAGLSAQQVLDAAQSLYETHKATTYPRTDCRYLPTSQHADAPAILRAVAVSDDAGRRYVAGADPARQSKAWNDSRITAHHAIIPTATTAAVNDMGVAEQTLYAMIRDRYIAQFHPDHEADKTTIAIEAAGGAFRATGRQVIVEGWRAIEASGSTDTNDVRLPVVRRGDTVAVANTDIEAKETEPPARYTEGTLIGAMKNAASLVTDDRLKHIMRDTAGLGTEATRAGIVETLQKRGFLVQTKKHLTASDAGRALIDALPDGVSNPETTALWEQALDDVSNGDLSLDDFIARQTRWVEAALAQVQNQGLNLPRVSTGTKNARSCPECGRPMRKRKSQHGPFWGCSGYPDCTATIQVGRGSRHKTGGRTGRRNETH
ncbi:DNA topoisomerase III [Salinisphaera orenii]|uniref:DNA topoisomerase III n=1 Tax=Salinisphaera orenii TaxID=856731 RepID=UPI0019550721